MTTALAEQLSRLPADEPEWLTALRQAALLSFERNGVPTTKNEDWHYTSPAPIIDAALLPFGAPTALPSIDDLAPYFFQREWPRLVFVNGRYAPSLSRVDTLGSDVRVMSLASALREEPTLLERHLAKVARFDEQAFAFTAINTALVGDGAVLQVSRNAAPALPVHLLFVTDTRNGAPGVTTPRVLIAVESNAKATIVEQYVSLGNGGYFTNAVTEASIADGATLHHLRLQREAPSAFHVGTFAASQGRDSHLMSFSLATGAALSRANIFTSLDGEGSGATLNGLYMLDGAQHGDHQTRIVHVRPNCYSRELYKGILDGESHGVFNGKVYVHPEAQKTDGKQTNNTLLLSERAKVDTKPQLEIFADDVKCTHGATVGRIDEMALFYLKSRGIPHARARRLLTYAFAAEVLETVPIESLRDELERVTLERFVG